MGDVIEEPGAVGPLPVRALAVLRGEVAVGGLLHGEVVVEEQVVQGGLDAGTSHGTSSQEVRALRTHLPHRNRRCVRNARYSGAVENEVGHEIADALGLLLRRTTRTQLHKQLTEGMGEAVDELTYPVLSALARTGPRSAADLAPDVGVDRSGVTRRASRLEAMRPHPP